MFYVCGGDGGGQASCRSDLWLIVRAGGSDESSTTIPTTRRVAPHWKVWPLLRPPRTNRKPSETTTAAIVVHGSVEIETNRLRERLCSLLA